MKKILKRFAAWATALQSNIFSWARISITALYLLIILLVLSVYSVAMYFSLLKNIQQQITVVQNSTVDHQLLDHAIDNLQFKIFIIDLGTFIVAAIGSYWLAGMTLRPIKRALEAQEAFSADASHELRTPLAVMKTDIEVLLRGTDPLPAQATAVLKSNLEEISLLTNMTTELLELSRGRHVSHESLQISAVIKDEIQKMQSLAHQKNITLSFIADTEGDFAGDRYAIARVIKNIIANAITYTPSGGSVAVQLTKKNTASLITITDTGVGIAPEHLAHIFKRFYKADHSGTSMTQGSGLGLAIVKHIVEQYGGTIEITSVPDQGTVVSISLPSRKL